MMENNHQRNFTENEVIKTQFNDWLSVNHRYMTSSFKFYNNFNEYEKDILFLGWKAAFELAKQKDVEISKLREGNNFKYLITIELTERIAELDASIVILNRLNSQQAEMLQQNNAPMLERIAELETLLIDKSAEMEALKNQEPRCILVDTPLVGEPRIKWLKTMPTRADLPMNLYTASRGPE